MPLASAADEYLGLDALVVAHADELGVAVSLPRLSARTRT
jgi:hypothetical protein